MSNFQKNRTDFLTLIKTISRGNTYVASRQIFAGELLMVETPFAAVPLINAGADGERQVSVNAYSNAAERSKRGDISSLAQLSISVLRCIQNDKVANLSIDALCSNIASRTSEEMNIFRQQAKMISKFIIGFTEAEILLLLDKLCRNVFTVTGPEMEPLGLALYINCTKFNHSCAPNAHQSFCSSNIFIHAARVIAKGEEITISYIDAGQPTAARRWELMNSYHFICHCEKCVYAELNNIFKCPQGKCKGSIYPLGDLHEKSLYINWLDGHIPSRISGNSYNYICHLPYAELINASMNKLCDNNLPVRFDQGDKITQFVCKKCRACVSMTSISSHVSILVGNNNNESKVENRVNVCTASMEAARALFFDNHYIVMDTTSKLVLEFLKHSMFQEALTVNLISLSSFQCVYSPASAVVAIQELQIGKLYAFIGDRSQAAFYVSSALKKIEILLGSDCALAQSAHLLLQSA